MSRGSLSDIIREIVGDCMEIVPPSSRFFIPIASGFQNDKEVLFAGGSLRRIPGDCFVIPIALGLLAMTEGLYLRGEV